MRAKRSAIPARKTKPPLPDLDLGAVLTWYKYGSQASSMVCAPEKEVGKRVLLAQLDNGKLRYDVELSGLDADDAEITGVQIAAGNGVPQEADTRGAIEMELPDGADYQNYILSVSATPCRKTRTARRSKRTWNLRSFCVSRAALTWICS